jgi:predicted component of type VI protein secretion system
VSVLLSPEDSGAARKRLIEAARNGEDPRPARARRARVVEYGIPDRDGKDLRSQSPDMIEQELRGRLLTHYAISALT